MYAQLEKPKENKSRAVVNSVAQKKSNVEQGFVGSRNREASPRRSQMTIQRKPNNIDKKYKIVLNADGKSTNPKGVRKNTSHATAINKLVSKKSFDSAEELIGGHLHKREYGGEDNDANVVPWQQTCENSFSNDFEKKYEAKFVDNKGKEVEFSAKATFADKDLGLTESAEWNKEVDNVITTRKKAILTTKLKPIKEALERIPTNVKTACLGESFDKSGTDIAPNYSLNKDTKDKLLIECDTTYPHIHKDKPATKPHVK